MTLPGSVSSWCRAGLAMLSLFMLSACTTAQQHSLSGTDRPVCDRQKGMCSFSWKIILVSKPDAQKADGQIFASGSSVYPVNKVTDIPFEINHSDQDKFAVVFSIGSADVSAFTFVTLTGVIHRGKSTTATFSQRISIRPGGTGEVSARAGDETFFISVTAPTFTPPMP
ncbi:hypothetical protein BGD62_003650 [Salmonella enterica]|nr:hypothetical protein [Salmonella enterica]